MSKLHQTLLAEPRRTALTHACADLIERHIRDRSGWRGTVMRTGLGLLVSVRADAVPIGVSRMLPDFVEAIAPFHAEFLGSGGTDFSDFLESRSERVASALIRVADERVAGSGHKTVKAAYKGLRQFAHGEVRRSLPDVGRLIIRHSS